MERKDIRDTFFANISHEFRTPLSVIAGMAELIRQDPVRWVDQGTEMIRLNSRDLLELVDQILDLQKLE